MKNTKRRLPAYVKRYENEPNFTYYVGRLKHILDNGYDFTVWKMPEEKELWMTIDKDTEGWVIPKYMRDGAPVEFWIWGEVGKEQIYMRDMTQKKDRKKVRL